VKAGGVKAQSSVAGMAACTSGRLGCTSRRVVVLRGRQRGQGGPRPPVTGENQGGEAHWS